MTSRSRISPLALARRSRLKLVQASSRRKALLNTAPKAPSSQARIQKTSAWKTCWGRERARKLSPWKPPTKRPKWSIKRTEGGFRLQQEREGHEFKSCENRRKNQRGFSP